MTAFAMLAALAITVQADVAAPPAPVPAPSPVSPQASAAQDDADSLATLKQVYETSCSDRSFYSYNDVCNELRDQVHSAEIAAARAARAAARRDAKAAKTVAPKPPT